MSIGDPEVLADTSELRVVPVEEPVAIAKRLELPLPHRELEPSELRPRDVALGQHAHERVDPAHPPVDRLQARRERRPADPGDSLLLAPPTERPKLVPTRVPEADEIQDAGIVEGIGRVDPRIGREPGGRFPGYGGERASRREPVG